MFDQSPTRFGPLGKNVAGALRRAILIKASEGVIALDNVHLRLSLRPDGVINPVRARTPADRWHALESWLFGAMPDDDTHESVANAPPPTTHEEERSIDEILGAVGAFLIAESSALREQIDISLAVEPAEDRPPHAQGALQQAEDALALARRCAHALFSHRGTGTWKTILTGEPVVVGSANLVATPTARPQEVVDGPGNPPAFEPRVPDTGWRPPLMVILDEVHRPDDRLSAFTRVRELLLRQLTAGYPHSERLTVVFVTVDGKQTDPLELNVVHPARLSDESDTMLERYLGVAGPRSGRGRVVTAVRARRRSSEEELLHRLEGLAWAMRFAVRAWAPKQVIVVSDAASLCPGTPSSLFASGALPNPDEFLLTGQEEGYRPDLRGCAVSLVAPRASRVFEAYWAAMCSEGAASESQIVWFDSPAQPAGTAVPRVLTGKELRLANHATKSRRCRRVVAKHGPRWPTAGADAHLNLWDLRRMAGVTTVVMAYTVMVFTAGTGNWIIAQALAPPLLIAVGVVLSLRLMVKKEDRVERGVERHDKGELARPGGIQRTPFDS
ncbi:hypothetical protein AB0A74_14525 [Saccharothrix sp. NPDC042600]|uniref:hypothetical protein n=1 Tax=Saccharothrix TaxID=2071 RepID=UPI0033DFE26B|nr:hypothetical protein GCM10017745_59170 [Saccharothrix mutabilis subsp. capreolus]